MMDKQEMEKYCIGIDNDVSTHEIWIADDVLIECKASHIKWWHRFFIRLFFGWKYKKSNEKTT